MGSITSIGAFCFGLVIGWVTYRTLRHTKTSGLSDIATVIGAVGGAAVTKLFPQESETFGFYCIGLAIGFFVYFIVSLVIARMTNTLSAVNEWLGEAPTGAGGGGGGLVPERK
jgi:fucose permease